MLKSVRSSRIEDVKIFHRAISEADAKEMFEAGRRGSPGGAE